MPAPLVALLGIAVAALAALPRPRVAFTAILIATVLVPDTLVLPTTFGSLLTVHLVTTLAALAGLLWRTADRRTPWSIWRPTGASLALGAYLLVVVVVGLGFAAPGVSFGPGADRAVDLTQQLLVLVACTALVREDGRPAAFVVPVVGVLMASTGIGVVEHFTRDSWDHYLLSHLKSQSQTASAAPLQTRGGSVRVRAGADFSLSYAAVLVGMLSMLVVGFVRATQLRWRLACLPVAALVSLAIYWSGTRSVIFAFGVMVVLFALLTARPRVILGVFVLAAVAVIVAVAVPAISHHFSIGIDSGSVDVRQQRVPVILGAVADRPFTGVGLSGLSLIGVSSVDSTYLLAYGETGAVGIAALFAVLVVLVVALLRGLWAPEQRDRLLVAGVISGVVAILAAGVALDAVDLPSVIDVVWELAAIGLVASEAAVGRPVRLLRPVRNIVLAGALGALFGGAAALSAPTHSASSFSFYTLPAIDDVGTGDPSELGDARVATACAAIKADAARLPGNLVVSCRNPFLASGEGMLRVQAGSASSVTSAIPHLKLAAKHTGLHAIRFEQDSGPTTGRPSGLVTLPASLAVFALIVAFGAPLDRREVRMKPSRDLRVPPRISAEGDKNHVMTPV